MKKYIFTVFAVAAVLTSCSKSLELNGDINSGAKAITTIGASTEISTRAVVSSSDDTKVNWETGDQLGVLGANGSSQARNLAYTLDGDGGSTIGTFKNGTSDITTISAIMYPYQASASWDGTNSKLTCEIPSVQKAVKGSFDKNAAVMYSIGNTTNVKLNYAVNFLKVTVSESETNVHAISISSSNALSGKMEITSSGVTAASSGSLKSVTLIAEKGQFLTAGDYYIAVKAGNIENPTISYVYLDQTNHTATEKSKAGSGTLSFAEDTNVKPISVDWTGATERKAFQLWENGPKFAEMNLGATSATEVGDTYPFSATGENDNAATTWGDNWRTPSKADMEHLMTAATGVIDEKVKCVYTQEGSTYGFKFTGITAGYTSNSVFFPAQGGSSNFGGAAYYWSGTADGSKTCRMRLYCNDGNLRSQWVSLVGQDYRCLVRPVLKN